MATPYVLNVDHQGTSCGDFCIYQTYEDQDEDIRSLDGSAKPLIRAPS